ncbi:transmembrane signal receptor [Lithospermum erythrorhizon]|uniref:Transmembrane signal receptor n=1 Tax=Lithospermum erythrorhizon TaxID=34254 RepID=A0AAV3R884_LITER
MGSVTFLVFSWFFCFYLIVHVTSSADRIYANQSLSGSQAIISACGIFKLGFFNPDYYTYNSSSYYLGIFYHKMIDRNDTVTSFWVVNREKPILYDKKSAVLKILDGNLVLLNEFQEPVWSTNVEMSSSHGSNDLVAVLRDDGNLVLTDESKLSFWQSFDHPGDTWLPGAKISLNRRTNTTLILTSWKKDIDNGPGRYSLELDRDHSVLMLQWNRSRRYWESGSWSDLLFSMGGQNRVFNFSYPTGECDSYALCGAFGICSEKTFPNCNCLDGFDPASNRSWVFNDFSDGCLRRKPLQCGNSSGSNKHTDVFKRMPLKHSDVEQEKSTTTGVSILECELNCLNNCSCTGYSYADGNCSIWKGDLLDLYETEALYDVETIYVRIAASEFLSPKTKRKTLILIGAVMLFFLIIFLVILLVFIRRCRNLRIKRSKEVRDSLVEVRYKGQRLMKQNVVIKLVGRIFGPVFKGKRPSIGGSQDELSEILIFSFETIQAVTDQFSASHKLGEGGFGPVFKGKLPNGQEIAIKRLSRTSDQGGEEFKNEIRVSD